MLDFFKKLFSSEKKQEDNQPVSEESNFENSQEEVNENSQEENEKESLF